MLGISRLVVLGRGFHHVISFPAVFVVESAAEPTILELKSKTVDGRAVSADSFRAWRCEPSLLSGNRNGLDSLQQSSSAHGRNGRDPAVDQEVCSDDVRGIVRREVNRQLRDFRRISHALAGIVGCKDALDRTALLFTGEAPEHGRVRRAWHYG